MTAYTYSDPATKPYPFCPGCSHGFVLDALSQALGKLGVPPERIALVTDIGCIGISDKHFTIHTFHGLHGRSVTYACGLKLARPELTVVVLMGDGALGIGGHHFLHAARRNVDITVLVCNNFNFGMTGGQHSVTTPHGAVTATTSEGNFEHPLDVVGLAGVAQASFGARCLFSDKRLPDLIEDGIRTRGFSVVDIWEMCTAYFFKRNKVKVSYLQQQMEALGLATGVVVRRDRPDYLSQYLAGCVPLAGKPVVKGTPLEVEFPATARGRRSVLLAGKAGQKVRSTAILLGRAGVLSGWWVTQRDDYPVTVMTGHSTAELVFEDRPVHELGVENPDIVVLTAAEGRDVVVDRLAGLPATSVVYTVPDLLPVKTNARVEVIPVAQLGLERKRTQVVLGCTAHVARQEGLVGLEALVRAARLEGREEISGENVETVRGAWELGGLGQ